MEVLLMDQEIHDNATFYQTVLRFYFTELLEPHGQYISLTMGRFGPKTHEPFLWIDATDNGETTRYLIKNGFQPLLLDDAIVRPPAT